MNESISVPSDAEITIPGNFGDALKGVKQQDSTKSKDSQDKPTVKKIDDAIEVLEPKVEKPVSKTNSEKPQLAKNDSKTSVFAPKQQDKLKPKNDDFLDIFGGDSGFDFNEPKKQEKTAKK